MIKKPKILNNIIRACQNTMLIPVQSNKTKNNYKSNKAFVNSRKILIMIWFIIKDRNFV